MVIDGDNIPDELLDEAESSVLIMLLISGWFYVGRRESIFTHRAILLTFEYKKHARY